MADANRDGRVSLAEAVATTKINLKSNGFDQEPVIAGTGADGALFSLSELSEVDKRFLPYGTMRVVLVGINKYSILGSDLRSPVNDVRALEEMFRRAAKKRLLAADVKVRSLIDEGATVTAIKEALAWLRNESKAGDMSVFFYSGHVAAIKRSDSPQEVKAIFPHDGDWKNNRYIAGPELVAELADSKGSIVVIVDG